MRARREPKNKVKKKVYLRNHNMCFSGVRPDHPRCRSATWICMCGHTRDPIIYSKFHRNPFRGFGAPGGQNLAFTITLASRFYNSLYYRTSRDYCTGPPTHSVGGQTSDALWHLSSSVTLHCAIIRLEAALPAQAR